MNKSRLFALALAGAVSLSLLAACGGKTEPTPTPEQPATPEATETPFHGTAPASEAPDESPAVTPTPELTAEPTAAPSVNPTVEPTPEPTVPPTATPEPTPTPTPEPAPTPEAKEPTAAEVYEKVSAKAGGSSKMDASFVLDSYYPDLTEDDFADFVLYVPEASANIEEILVAKVASGKLDAVKKACESRIQGIKEDAEMYVSTGAYVDSYQLVTEGDWLLFCVCEKPNDAVKAFRDAVK